MHSSAFQDQRPLLPAGGRTDHDNPVRALHQAAQPVEHHWILHIGRKAQESGLINNAVGIIRREFLVIYNDDLVDETVPEIAQYHPHEKEPDRKSTRLNSSHYCASRMPSSACKKKINKQNIITYNQYRHTYYK